MNQIPKNNFSTIEQMTGQFYSHKLKNEPACGTSFQEILNQRQAAKPGDLKFSRHASERLKSRNIDLSGDQMERLATGASRAKEKGIEESLVMVDNLAFIVNIRNNTVVTAVNDTENAVFTNIDGAVIS